MEKKLDDISLGVHSIFGRQFRQLWLTDKEWVQDHLSEIFPRSQSRHDIEKFTAAWDSYVAFNTVFPEIFRDLREYYFHAVDLMADGEHTETINVEQRMAGHLLFNYLYEYDLANWSESLLAYFYDRSDPEMARHVAWHLSRHGADLDEDDILETWEKTRFLWKKRLEQVSDDETYSDEISWFIEWIEYLEGIISLDEIVMLLSDSDVHIANNRRTWKTMEEYLARQSEQYTKQAVGLFHTLVLNFGPPPYRGFTDEVAAILRPGFENYNNNDEEYQQSFKIAQKYASNGHSEAQKFIDRHR